MVMAPPVRLLQVDSRNRISLGDLATHAYYIVDVEDDGVIILTPAVIAPAVPEYARPTPVIPWQGKPRIMYSATELPADTEFRKNCACLGHRQHSVDEACPMDRDLFEGRNTWSPSPQDREENPPHVTFNAA